LNPQSVSVDLVSRETLVAELQAAAKPLSDSCTPEISAKVEAAVEEAVTAYSTTCTNLKELCIKYQHAADLWKRYRDASDLVSEWVDNHMESVANLEPEEAIKAVKVFIPAAPPPVVVFINPPRSGALSPHSWSIVRRSFFALLDRSITLLKRNGPSTRCVRERVFLKWVRIL
jgi:hypothetical protein